MFRLNFSHGTHETHLHNIRMIREVGFEMSRPFAILGDLSGPKLRIGNIAAGEVLLSENDIIVLTSDAADGTGLRFQVTIDAFHQVAQPGETILLDDGRFAVVVEHISGRDVQCRLMNGGILKPRKGVNLPDTKLPIPALTEKDRRDMEFALREGVDVLALSFVRSPEDITQAKDAMRAFGREVPLYAKIEKKEAVEHLEAILRLADGAMVARGDLGIEIPMQQVPAVQKRVIRLCNELGKPVITATQMLESMISNPRPTRAEVTDIYNAIVDGTDAVMLSAGTASGDYPVEAVEMMDSVAGEAEKHIRWNQNLDTSLEDRGGANVTHVVCNAVVQIAEQLKLDLIIIPTQTGYSAYHVSRFKPSVPIFACSTDAARVNALCLAWGVSARVMSPLNQQEVAMSETDALMNEVIRCAKHYGFVKSGQRVVVLGGLPLGLVRHTNNLRVVEID